MKTVTYNGKAESGLIKDGPNTYEVEKGQSIEVSDHAAQTVAKDKDWKVGKPTAEKPSDGSTD